MKFILFSILILFSINRFATNWKKILKSKNGSSFYVDIDNIKKRNGLVYYWELTDYPKLDKFDDFSTVTKFEVDCEKRKKTYFNFTTYGHPMGEGRTITELTPNKTIYLKKFLIGYTLMKFVCARAK